MTKNPSDAICSHCKMPIRIRNPSGFCDHLYYPESCEICKKADAKPKSPVSKDARSPETSEIRELLAKERKQSDESERFIINTGQKELALKSKRIAELEEAIKIVINQRNALEKENAELKAEVTDKNLPPLEWAKIHAKDREQAHSQGRNEAIAEIEFFVENSFECDCLEKKGLEIKLASMKKAKA